jgi:hypothetical protein
MSGWDASSRPTWDPQGGADEATSVGIPGFADSVGDRWPEASATRANGASGAPGTPPDIFLQAYDSPDNGRRPEHSKQERPANGYGRGAGRRSRQAQPRQDYSSQDFPAQDFPSQDFPAQGYASREFPTQGYPTQGYPSQDFPSQDRPAQDRPTQDRLRYGPTRGRRDYPDTTQDSERADRGFQDRGFQDPGFQDPGFQDGGFQDRGFQDRGFQDRGYPGFPDEPRADRDSAARMDPALRDFFAPQPGPARPDGAQRYGGRGAAGQGTGFGTGPLPVQGPGGQGPGAQGPGGQGPGGQGPGPGYRPARRPAPPQGPGAPQSRPGRTGLTGPMDGLSGDWDDESRRPAAPRPPRRQDNQPRRKGNQPQRRGSMTVSVVIGVIVVLVIAIVAVLVLRHKSSPPAASGGGSRPTTSATPKTTASAAVRGDASNAYVLTTPATAGGYKQATTAVPTAVQTDAGTTAQAVKADAVSASAKITKQVSAYYQLDSGQVLSFAGFEGTFNPAKVVAKLASLGTEVTAQAAGAHGGKLTCFTESTQNGTVCVWVTTTTMGVTEFFSSSGPEVVTHQAKAASDTVKLRDGLEAPKS